MDKAILAVVITGAIGIGVAVSVASDATAATMPDQSAVVEQQHTGEPGGPRLSLGARARQLAQRGEHLVVVRLG